MLFKPRAVEHSMYFRDSPHRTSWRGRETISPLRTLQTVPLTLEAPIDNITWHLATILILPVLTSMSFRIQSKGLFSML